MVVIKSGLMFLRLRVVQVLGHEKIFFIIWLCVCAIGEDTSVGHSRGLHLFGCIGLLCGIRERSVRPKIIGPWLQYTNILLNREVL